MNKLEVIKFKDGSIARESQSKPGHYNVMVKGESFGLTANGALTKQTRYSFMTNITEETLATLNLVEGCDLNQKIKALGLPPLKLIVKETTEKTNENQEPKRYPEGHDLAGQPVVDINGNAIYRTTYLVPATDEFQDELIQSSTSVAANAVSQEAPQEAGNLA